LFFLNYSKVHFKLLFALAIIALVSFNNEVLAEQKKVKIDIKSPLSERYTAETARSGLGAVLSISDWMEEVEFGEDYQLRIQNFTRKVKANTIYYNFEIELQDDSSLDPLSQGNSLEKMLIVDSLNLSEIKKEKNLEESELVAIVEKQLKQSSSLENFMSSLTRTAVDVNFYGAGTVLQNGLNILGIDINRKITQTDMLEGMYLGAKIMIKLDSMIKKQEKKKLAEQKKKDNIKNTNKKIDKTQKTQAITPNNTNPKTKSEIKPDSISNFKTEKNIIRDSIINKENAFVGADTTMKNVKQDSIPTPKK
jgi:hypothetical protein